MRHTHRTWPREMNTRLGLLTIYQPQPEKFETNPDEDQSPPENARAGEE